MQQTGIDPAVYAHRPLPPGRPLPWTHILCHHGELFLQEEYRRIQQELEKPEAQDGAPADSPQVESPPEES